jgi:hypothetical protein
MLDDKIQICYWPMMRQSDGQVVFLYAHWGQLFYIDIGLPVQASALPGGGGEVGCGGGGGWGDRAEGWKTICTLMTKIKIFLKDIRKCEGAKAF